MKFAPSPRAIHTDSVERELWILIRVVGRVRRVEGVIYLTHKDTPYRKAANQHNAEQTQTDNANGANHRDQRKQMAPASPVARAFSAPPPASLAPTTVGINGR